MRLPNTLEETVKELEKDFDAIPTERQELLLQLSGLIREKLTAGQPVQLVFICTHNSRRSHMAQLWAQAAAACYGIPNVHTYSGGTEATAFNPRAVKAMQKLGFQIEQQSESDNPKYQVTYADGTAPLLAWSKRFDDAANPDAAFFAIMTCSDADENCPFVPGVEKRIGITYDDPKHFDSTPQEEAKYLERARQIGREMLFVMKHVK